MFAELSAYRMLDVAACIALINLLKSKYMKNQEIFRTLLAMFLDYHSADVHNRKKLIHYMKLMIPDKELLKSLLVTLPEASSSNRPQKTPQNTLPKPDKILLPPKPQESNREFWESRYGCDLRTQKNTSQTVAKKPSTSIDSITQGLSAETTRNQEETPVYTFWTNNNEIQREIITGRRKSTPRTLQRSDDQEQMMHMMGIDSRGHFVQQQFFSPMANQIPYPSYPYTQAYPGYIRYPSGMTVRPMIPVQPVHMFQPSGRASHIPPTSLQHIDLNYSEAFSCTEATFKSIKSDHLSKGSKGRGIQRQQPTGPLTSKGYLSIDDLLSSKQNKGTLSGGGKLVKASQSMTQLDSKGSDAMASESVSKSNSIKEDTTSLESLAKLTSSVGCKNESMEPRDHVGAKNSALLESLSVKHPKQCKSYPINLQRKPAVLSAHASAPHISQNFPSMPKVHTEDKDDSPILMKSFPYCQEIKLEDGKYILINSSAEKKMFNLRGDDEKSDQMSTSQNLKTPLRSGLAISPNSTVVESSDLLEKMPVRLLISNSSDSLKMFPNRKRKSRGSVDLQNDMILNSSHGQHANKKLDSGPISTLKPTSVDEKKCMIQIQNEATNEQITERLRKRIQSEFPTCTIIPMQKKARLLDDDVVPSSTATDFKPNASGSSVAFDLTRSILKPVSGSPTVPPDIPPAASVPVSVSHESHFSTGRDEVKEPGAQCVTNIPSNAAVPPAMSFDVHDAKLNTSEVTTGVSSNEIAEFGLVMETMISDDIKSSPQAVTCTSDIDVRPVQYGVTDDASEFLYKIVKDAEKCNETLSNKSDMYAAAVCFDQGTEFTQTDDKLDATFNRSGNQKRTESVVSKDDEESATFQGNTKEDMMCPEMESPINNSGDFQRSRKSATPKIHRRKNMLSYQLCYPEAESTTTSTSTRDFYNDSDNYYGDE